MLRPIEKESAKKSKVLNMCNHIIPHMGNITLALPDDLHERMKKHSEIRWSEVVRKSIHNKVELLEAMESIAQKSKLTQKDVNEIASMIKKELAEDFNNQ